MKKLLAIAIALALVLSAFAESTTEKALSGSRPPYPIEARQMRITGSGVYMLRVNESGSVVRVDIAKHSGSKLLDDSAVNTFLRWRFKAGKPPRWVRMPVTWSLP